MAEFLSRNEDRRRHLQRTLQDRPGPSSSDGAGARCANAAKRVRKTHAASKTTRPVPAGGYRAGEPRRATRQRDFRRTQIARSQKEVESAGRQVALEALEIIDSKLRLYPKPV